MKDTLTVVIYKFAIVKKIFMCISVNIFSSFLTHYKTKSSEIDICPQIVMKKN